MGQLGKLEQSKDVSAWWREAKDTCADTWLSALDFWRHWGEDSSGIAYRRTWSQEQYTINSASDNYYYIVNNALPGDIIIIGPPANTGNVSHSAVVYGVADDGTDLIIGQHGSTKPFRYLSEIITEYSDELHNSGEDVFALLKIKDGW